MLSVAQLEEHQIVALMVAGSSPVRQLYADIAQQTERAPCKRKVVSLILTIGFASLS